MTDATLIIPDSSSDWVEIVNISKEDLITGDNSHVPIDPFACGILTSSEFYAVIVNTVAGKSSWVWAGSLSRLFPFQQNTDTTPIGKAIYGNHQLSINKAQLLQFDRLSPISFDFYYFPPKWFKDVRIRVWEFVGETYNPREDQLNRIENYVAP